MIAVPSTVTVAGTTLFHLSADAFQDATLWTVIARANGMLDPWVDDIATLTIPRPTARQPDGGVLGG